MKYISFVVPCYNSQDYMAKCIESLLIGGDEIEIIIVNDGSKDNTINIAREYEQRYPNIIKVIDKENGGHGSGVNAGMDNSTGLYFKCVDSDDWVDKDAYITVLETIKKHYQDNTLPDLYLTNFIYERPDINKQHRNEIRKRFPLNQIITWDKVKKFSPTEFLMMHNLIYRLEVLKESKVRLLEHTFYVDNLFLYVPLPFVKTLYFIDVDFYRYFVGRANQSVTLENMTKNYKHQLRVMEALTHSYSYEFLKTLPKKQRNFILQDFIAKSFLTLFYISTGNNDEKNQAYKEYFERFKKNNRGLYNKLRYRSLFFFPFLLPRFLRNKVVMWGYKKIINTTGWN